MIDVFLNIRQGNTVYMRFILLFMVITISACETHHISEVFEKYLWQKRVVLVFAPDLSSELLLEQEKMLTQDEEGIKERDIVKWILVKGETVVVDGRHQPHMPTGHFYDYFELNSDVFTVMVIGKDGTEKLRQHHTTISLDELFAMIDAMPIRQKEVKGHD